MGYSPWGRKEWDTNEHTPNTEGVCERVQHGRTCPARTHTVCMDVSSVDIHMLDMDTQCINHCNRLVLIAILGFGIYIYITCPRKELLRGRVEYIRSKQIPDPVCLTMLCSLQDGINMFVWKIKQSYIGFLTTGLFKIFPRLFNSV